MSAQRKVICEGELLKRCRFAWSPRHVCLMSMDDEQLQFQLLIYDQRQRKLKKSFTMDEISSVKPSKVNSFQILLNRRGHPVIHFRSKSQEELKNWMALLKVGMAKGNIFHVKVISKVNLINEHALIRFFGYAEDGSASNRVMELYDPISDDPIYIWRLDKIRQFVRTDIGVRMDLCQRCFRSHQQPHSHTFMVPTYFLDKCIFFLCREVGSMHIFVSQVDNDVGAHSTVYQITSHNCGDRLHPPTSPPPPPPDVPQKRSKKKLNPPIPARDIPRRGYPDAPDPLPMAGPVQPYVVSKRIHIDEHGKTLRLSGAPPKFPVFSYHGSPVIRPPPRCRTRTAEEGTQRDSFWMQPLLKPSPTFSVPNSSDFTPVNRREFEFEGKARPPLQQHKRPSDSSLQQKGEEAASSGSLTDERAYYNWSRFRSTFSVLATSPKSPFETLAPPVPPRLPTGSTASSTRPLRANHSMKVSEKRRSQSYFMEKDSIVGVVPSVEPFPSSESSELFPPKNGDDVPGFPHKEPGLTNQRASTVDFSEFDAYALDTMEGCPPQRDTVEGCTPQRDSVESYTPQRDTVEGCTPQRDIVESYTPQRDSPMPSHGRPNSYSRTLHRDQRWEDLDAEDAEGSSALYINVPRSSYSKVCAPQYRNLSAVWVQDSPAERLEPVQSGSQHQSGNHGDSSQGGDRLGDQGLGENAQEGNHDGDRSQEVSSSIQQQPSADDRRELESASMSAETRESESFRVRDETGQLSPIHTGGFASTSEAARNPPRDPITGLPRDVGPAHGALLPESGTSSDTPRTQRTPLTPPPRPQPAQNPIYVSSPPRDNMDSAAHSRKPARSAPAPPPKPPVGIKPSNNTAYPHPSHNVSTRSKQPQHGEQPSPLQSSTHREEAQHSRPFIVHVSPTPAKPVRPAPAPRPPPEKVKMKVTGTVQASGSHFQTKLLANRTTVGCHGDETRRTPGFGEHKLPEDNTTLPHAPHTSQTPPPPPPKPKRTIFH